MNVNHNHVPIVILGAGFSGLSAAFYIEEKSKKNSYNVFEQKSTPGGVCSSFHINGFTFDYGIHGIYSKNKDFIKYVNFISEGQHDKFDIIISDYWKNNWSPHPMYRNLSSIQKKYSASFSKDFIENNKSITYKDNDSLNFKEWSIENFGNKISNYLIFPYIKKFWGVSPKELTNEWIGNRIKVPTSNEMKNILSKKIEYSHYVKKIYYPKIHGFGWYSERLASKVNICFDKKIILIDTSNKYVKFSNGEIIEYDSLISTIPLPEIVNIIKNVPNNIIESAKKLRATSLMLISIGINRANLLRSHWVYSLDPDIPFSRLSSPSLWSKNNAPNGTSSLQAEVYFSDKVLNEDIIFKNVISSLKKMGILLEEDEIIAKDIRVLKYANIIYDKNRSKHVDIIHKYLNKNNILFCGRYASWDYSLLDQVSLQSRYVAKIACETQHD